MLSYSTITNSVSQIFSLLLSFDHASDFCYKYHFKAHCVRFVFHDFGLSVFLYGPGNQLINNGDQALKGFQS